MTNSEKIILELNKKNVLWHGLELDNFKEAHKRNALLPYTSHRFWKNGQRLKDNDPNYESSFFKYGWSTSREFFKATQHGNVIIAFSKEKIEKHFKIEPIAWNYLFSSEKHHKKEKEEFVLSGGMIESKLYFEKKVNDIDLEYEKLEEKYFDNLISEKMFKEESERLQKERDGFDFDLVRGFHHGKELSLNNAFGFFIKKGIVNIENYLKSEKFLGFIN